MKITGEVIAVETTGDHLRVTMQTNAEADAEWFPMGRATISVQANNKNGRTYYVGRVVNLTMEPKYV